MNWLSKLGHWALETIGWGLKLAVLAAVLGVSYIAVTLLLPGERAVREFFRLVSVGGKVLPDGHTGVFDAARSRGLKVKANPGQKDETGRIMGASIVVHNGFLFSDGPGSWQCVIEHDGGGKVTAVRVQEAVK